MRNNRFLRGSLASLAVCGLALSAFVVACGDDDTGGGVIVPGVDSGGVDARTDTGPGTDSGGTDSGGTDSGNDSGKDAGADADAGPQPVAAKLQLINAGTDFGPNNTLGALRICYKIGVAENALNFAPLPPLPNRQTASQKAATLPPGLYVGTGGPVDSTGARLETLIIKPYLISASKLDADGQGSTVTAGNDKTCQELIEGTAANPTKLTLNTNYWILPNVPAGTLKNDKSYILALTGCTGDSAKTAAECGGTLPTGVAGNGSLALTVLELDRSTAVDAAKLGTQFTNLSPNIGLAISPAKVHPVINQAGDAGAPRGDIAGDVADTKTISAISQISGVVYTTDTIAINAAVASVSVPLTSTKLLSYGTPTPPAAIDYANGKAFTVVAIGNALEPQGGPTTPNLKAFHFLMLPNDPLVADFDATK